MSWKLEKISFLFIYWWYSFVSTFKAHEAHVEISGLKRVLRLAYTFDRALFQAEKNCYENSKNTDSESKMSLCGEANQRENRCWLFTNGMLIDWGAFLSYQWLSFTNGDHLPVVPLVRVFWRLGDFYIVKCAQLNLKYTGTENYLNIFLNSSVQCSRNVEDLKRNFQWKCWRLFAGDTIDLVPRPLPGSVSRLPMGDLGSILQLVKVIIFKCWWN